MNNEALYNALDLIEEVGAILKDVNGTDLFFAIVGVVIDQYCKDNNVSLNEKIGRMNTLIMAQVEIENLMMEELQ